jgi:hypothetical protein
MLRLYSVERSSGIAFAKIHRTVKKEAVDCRWILHAFHLQGLRKPLKISVSCPGRESKESLTKYIKSNFRVLPTGLTSSVRLHSEKASADDKGSWCKPLGKVNQVCKPSATHRILCIRTGAGLHHQLSFFPLTGANIPLSKNCLSYV